MDLTGLFRFIVSLSLLGSILAVFLIIMKTLLRGKLSANLQYYIWFILLLRLVLPYTQPIPFNLINHIPHYEQAADLTQITGSELTSTELDNSYNNEPAKVTNDNISGNAVVEQNKTVFAKWFNWQTAAVIWFIGVLTIFMYLLCINGLFIFKYRKLPKCDSNIVLTILQQCKQKLKLKCNVPVVYDDSLKSPGVFGIFHPKIIISPEIIEQVSDSELSFIFLHELSHLKRRDQMINFLRMAIQVVYWFNPLIWIALKLMKQDCEIACDATALAALNPEDHKCYGQTIINLWQLLSKPYWVPGTLGFASKYHKRRIAMISTVKKTKMAWAVFALALTLVAGCSSQNNTLTPVNNNQNANSSNSQKNTNDADSSLGATSIIYSNSQYGFNFKLPSSWKGYTIINGSWEGNDIASGKITETGTMISIRHPKWTAEKKRQDIPIMIFTTKQWNLLQQEKFHIGAAPIGPSALGSNNNYVFALPARYNYAFPIGYEEVEKIIKNHPLQSTSVSTDAQTTLLLNMMQLAKLGKVINCDFPAKTSTIETVEQTWGKADETVYIAAAKGRYATYKSNNTVFGINKGEQIFEVRSFDNQLKNISLAKAKEVFGTPAWDSKTNSQEMIGYTAGNDFKIEMVFPLPTGQNTNPVMDHYNVLYPDGTVNSMANDPGRKW